MLVRDFLQPATVLGDDATVADAAAALARDAGVFVRGGDGWQAILPRVVLGYPATRRLIDVPLHLATAVAAGDEIDVVLDQDHPLEIVPVEDHGAFVGCVDRCAVLDAVAATVDPAQLGVLLLTRLTPTLIHDLANALTVADATLSMVGRLGDGDDGVEVARLALGQAGALLRRARELSHGADDGAPVPVDLAALLIEIQPLLDAALGRDRHLTLDLAPRTPWVLGHRRAIERTVLNLVLNARDAMTGPGRVHVSVRQGAGRQIEIVVDDDGPGIAPALAPRIFVAGTSTRRGAARGLGLAAVVGTLHRIGGSIELTASALGGAAFLVMLPQAP
ncbi:MAG: sensor histidine kinase [Kofleriaceae bacterium]|nr:sensor histidine kinase [Kofleriaceae bacterium]